jgi:hypothetical protein
MPAKAQALHERLVAWRKHIGAAMPAVNDGGRGAKAPPAAKPRKARSGT